MYRSNRLTNRPLHAVSMLQLNNSVNQQSLCKGLFSALLSLGLDVEGIGKIVGNPLTAESMINLPKRAGDLILHHLFLCIDKDKAVKLFRDCWPTTDKRREAQFYKAAFEWYKVLVQQENSSSSVMNKSLQPLVVSRTVVTPSSHKFTSTIMTLSKIALRNSIKKKGNTNNMLQQPNYIPSNKKHNRNTLKIILAQTLQQQDRFCSIQQTSLNEVMRTNSTAKLLVKEYRTGMSRCEDLKKEVQDLSSSLSEYAKVDVVKKPLNIFKEEIKQRLQHMNSENKSHWNEALKSKESEMSSYKTLKPLVQATAHLSHMSASQLKPDLPQDAVRDFIKAGFKLPNLYGGKNDSELDLKALLQTAQLSLQTLNVSLPLNITDDNNGDNDSTGEENVSSTTQQRAASLKCCVKELCDETQICRDELNVEVNELRENLNTEYPVDYNDDTKMPSLCPPSPPFNLNYSNTDDENTPSSDSRCKYSMITVTPNTLHNAVFNDSSEESANSKPIRKLYNFPTLTFASPQNNDKITPKNRKPCENDVKNLPCEFLTMDQRASHQQNRNRIALENSKLNSSSRFVPRKAPLSSRKYNVASKLPMAALSRSCSKNKSNHNRINESRNTSKENNPNYGNTCTISTKKDNSFGHPAKRKLMHNEMEDKKPEYLNLDDSIDKLASMVAQGFIESHNGGNVTNRFAETLYEEALSDFQNRSSAQNTPGNATNKISEETLWGSAKAFQSAGKNGVSSRSDYNSPLKYASPLLRKYPLQQSIGKNKDLLKTPATSTYRINNSALNTPSNVASNANTPITPKYNTNLNLKYNPAVVDNTNSPIMPKVIDGSPKLLENNCHVEVDDVHAINVDYELMTMLEIEQKNENMFTPKKSKTEKYKYISQIIRSGGSIKQNSNDSEANVDYITSPPSKWNGHIKVSMMDDIYETNKNIALLQNKNVKDNLNINQYGEKSSKLRLETKAHINNLIDIDDDSSYGNCSTIGNSNYIKSKNSSSLMQNLKLENSNLFKDLLDDVGENIGSNHCDTNEDLNLIKENLCEDYNFKQKSETVDFLHKKSADRGDLEYKNKMEATQLPSIREATFEKSKTEVDLDKYLKEFEEKFLECNDWKNHENLEDQKLIDFVSDDNTLKYDDLEFVDGSLVADSLGLGLCELPSDDCGGRSVNEHHTQTGQSMFDTLTESILIGETDSVILQGDNAKKRIARESLCLSSRLSGESICRDPRRRSSASSNKRLSQLFNEFNRRNSSENCIMDVSDSILLSTSFDGN